VDEDGTRAGGRGVRRDNRRWGIVNLFVGTKTIAVSKRGKTLERSYKICQALRPGGRVST
jgi:hypothetical protein